MSKFCSFLGSFPSLLTSVPLPRILQVSITFEMVLYVTPTVNCLGPPLAWLWTLISISSIPLGHCIRIETCSVSSLN